MAVQLFLKLLFQLAAGLFLLSSADAQELKHGFYKKSCPSAEALVRKTVAGFLSQDVTVAAPLLRLHFHDCFVRGCDGSVLLNSTKNKLAEKDAIPNLSLDGFYVIDAAKEALEKACPGVVSCADIVALATRDAISLITGPVGKGNWTTSNNLWEVATGRRDGLVSLASEALTNLPSPYANLTQLKASFKARGLIVRDLAVLSGAHSIGNSHCSSFIDRLYNFTGKGDADPSLDPNYAMRLRNKCRQGGVDLTTEMVPGSSTTFDTDYYKLVAKRRGLFHSDAVLLKGKRTRRYVYSHLVSPQSSFFFDFGVSMVRMGKIGVLTGKAGEIRKHCALVNDDGKQV